MPVPGITTELYKCTMFLRYLRSGWSETYYLPTTNMATAVTIAGQLCTWRSYIMGKNVQMVYGRVNKALNPRDALPAFDGVLNTLPLVVGGTQWDAPNNPGVGPLFKFLTVDGKWVNKIFRGVGDGVVIDSEYSYSPFAPAVPAAPGVFPATVISSLTPGTVIFNNVLTALRDNTVYASKIKPFNQAAPSWLTVTWDRVRLNKIGQRDTGRPFGESRGRALARV